MATLGHVAVGVATARGALPSATPLHRLALTMAAFSLVALAPDLDVIAFRLDIPYEAPWGHRGAGHSLAVAILFGSLLGAAVTLPGCSRLRSTVVTAAVAASHGLLDVFTDGGLGIALFWPFSVERLFAPWQPIPVAPIGRGLLSARGMDILLTEILYFSPALVYAFWPRVVWRRIWRRLGRIRSRESRHGDWFCPPRSPRARLGKRFRPPVDVEP